MSGWNQLYSTLERSPVATCCSSRWPFPINISINNLLHSAADGSTPAIQYVWHIAAINLEELLENLLYPTHPPATNSGASAALATPERNLACRQTASRLYFHAWYALVSIFNSRTLFSDCLSPPPSVSFEDAPPSPGNAVAVAFMEAIQTPYLIPEAWQELRNFKIQKRRKNPLCFPPFFKCFIDIHGCLWRLWLCWQFLTFCSDVLQRSCNYSIHVSWDIYIEAEAQAGSNV